MTFSLSEDLPEKNTAFKNAVFHLKEHPIYYMTAMTTVNSMTPGETCYVSPSLSILHIENENFICSSTENEELEEILGEW